MNSADAWSESNAWPANPHGSMAPILEASIEAEQAKIDKASGAIILTSADRCDHCGSAAVYRVARKAMIEGIPVQVSGVLDFCLHAWRKHFPPMVAQGWAVIGGNPVLLHELGKGRTQGEDHA